MNTTFVNKESHNTKEVWGVRHWDGQLQAELGESHGSAVIMDNARTAEVDRVNE